MTGIDEKYSFDSYEVGESNKLAYVAALAVMEDPGRVYNPLFIYGESGTGKTHLLNAIGLSLLKQDPNIKVLYNTAEQLTKEIIDACRHDAVEAMKEKYRLIDVLIVDDIQYIAGKETTQEMFFQLFNIVYSNNKQILLSSDKNPNCIKNLEGRLVSRFMWGLPIEIKPPDLGMRINILMRIAESYDFPLKSDVIDKIAENIAPNVFEEEGYIKKLMLFAKSNQIKAEDITTNDAYEVLKGVSEHMSNNCPLDDTNELYKVDKNILRETIKSMVDSDCYEGVRTGFYSLDSLINGFGKGQLTVLGARPAMGKTTLACSIIENACIRDKKNCLYFTAEDSKESVLQRIIRIHGNLRYKEKDFGKMEKSAADIPDAPLWIYENPAIYIDELVEKCREFRETWEIDLVVVDYLQLISEDTTGTDTIVTQKQVLSKLKALAEEMQCAVLVLSQLNRSAEKRPQHFPIVKDFAAHTALGRYADVILLLYREFYYNIRADKTHATVMIARSKKRSGICTSLRFDADIPKFFER